MHIVLAIHHGDVGRFEQLEEFVCVRLVEAVGVFQNPVNELPGIHVVHKPGQHKVKSIVNLPVSRQFGLTLGVIQGNDRERRVVLALHGDFICSGRLGGFDDFDVWPLIRQNFQILALPLNDLGIAVLLIQGQPEGLVTIQLPEPNTGPNVARFLVIQRSEFQRGKRHDLVLVGKAPGHTAVEGIGEDGDADLVEILAQTLLGFRIAERNAVSQKEKRKLIHQVSVVMTGDLVIGRPDIRHKFAECVTDILVVVRDGGVHAPVVFFGHGGGMEPGTALVFPHDGQRKIDALLFIVAQGDQIVVCFDDVHAPFNLRRFTTAGCTQIGLASFSKAPG